MNSYYIKERNMEMNYIELRFLMEFDCDLKIEKITEILTFLNKKGFISNLVAFRTDIRSEDIFEKEDVMSLTIDTRNKKMRFKFWNGMSTMWLFHIVDLFDALDTGREKFASLYDKYEPITDIILSFKKRWSTSIDRISYQYYTDNADIVYNIIFTNEVRHHQYADVILKKINKEIDIFKEDNSNNEFKFKIEYSYNDTVCTPCEAKKRENLNENK